MIDQGDGKKNRLTRRDFLKLAGAGAGTLALYRDLPWISRLLGDTSKSVVKSIEYKNVDLKEIVWKDFDFVSNPELLKVRGLKEKMIGELVDWKGRARDVWKYEANLLGNNNALEVDDKLWEQNARRIVERTYEQAELLESSLKHSLFEVEEEQARKYYEYATWLRYVLVGSKYLSDMPIEQCYEKLVTINEQNIPTLSLGGDGFDDAMPEGFKRLQINSQWNYPWKDMAGGGTTGLHPIWKIVVSSRGEEFVFGPDTTTAFLIEESKRNVEQDIFSIEGRPKRMRIIDLDADVARLVEEKFRKLGLDRGVTSFRWMNIDSFAQGVTDPRGNVNIGGGVSELDEQTYLSHATLYDEIGYHEANHALITRSSMLEGIDRLKYRDLMLRVFRRYDPLRSLKSIFAPDGEYPNVDDYTNELDYGEAVTRNKSELFLTSYYLDILLGSVYGETVKNYMDELRNGLLLMGGQDFYYGIWPENVNTIEEYFESLQGNNKLRGVSKLVAEVMLVNKESIINMKKQSFRYIPELFRITEVVLPLVLTHLAQYQTDELEAALLEDGVDQNVVRSFFINWQMRLDNWIKGRPCEELLGEVFGNMMTDNGRDAKNRWNETFNDFAQMLLLLKRNQLAYKPQTTV